MPPARSPSIHPWPARGAALLFAMILIAIVTIVGAAILKMTGQDRIEAAKLSARGAALACAEAGLQFGRRYFGCAYKTSDNWNAFLRGEREATVTGNLDGTTPGKDFQVIMWDDEDEVPEGVPADDPDRDNNLTIIIESSCTSPGLAPEERGVRTSTTVRALLTYVPGLSDHGSAPSGSNANEAAAGGSWVHLAVGDCE